MIILDFAQPLNIVAYSYDICMFSEFVTFVKAGCLGIVEKKMFILVILINFTSQNPDVCSH